MPVGFDKLFDLEKSVSDLNMVIDALPKLSNAYSKTIGEISKELQLVTKLHGDLVKSIEETTKAKKKLDVTTEKGRQAAAEDAKEAEGQKEQYLYLTKQIKDLEGNIKALKSEENKFNKQREETLKNNRDLIALQTKLTSLESNEAQEIAKLRTQISEKNKELKESAKESLKLVSLYQRETKQLNDLRKQYKDVALQFGVNSKEAKELQKQVGELDTKIKEIDANAGQFQRNVGNYPELFQSMGGAMGHAASGVQTLGTGLKALAANPVGAVLVVIVGAVTLLFNGFKKLTGGAEFLEKAVSALSTTFSTLLTRVGQLITGEIGWSEFLFGTVDAVKENIRASNTLIEVRRDLENQTSRTAYQEARLAKNIIELQSIRDNDTKSLKQRREAAEKLLESEKQLSEQSVNLAKLEVKEKIQALAKTGVAEKEIKKAIEEGTIAEENRIKVNEDGRLALNDLITALAAHQNAENELLRTQYENAKEIEMIRLDQFEQELDLLLDIEDRRKSVNERSILDEKTTLSQKQKLLRDNVNAIEDSYNKQIETFKRYFNVQLDEKKILELNGEELYKYTASLGLSERAVNRLREVVIEKLAADRDNLDSINDVNKALERQRMLEGELTEIIESNNKSRIKGTDETNKTITKSWSDYYQVIRTNSFNFYKSIGDFAKDSAIRTFEILQEKLTKTSDKLREGLTSLVDFQVGQDQRRINSLEENRQKELMLVGDNADAKARINEAYDKRIEQVEKQQARRQRKIAIFEKAISITQAIIALNLASLKAGVITPKAIATAILGAVKIAAIVAQPIPQYAKGTDYHKGGLAIVGDGGKNELVQEPSGKMWVSPKKSTLVDLPKGSRVMDGIMTERMMAASRNMSERAMNIGKENNVKVTVNDNSDKIAKVLQDRPELSIDFVNGRFVKNLRKGNTKHIDWTKSNTY
ncbi:hypothetical protein EP331_00195 [bacterium]|nr:MAG: hypothetical protein EP331_00195 [bacterium]